MSRGEDDHESPAHAGAEVIPLHPRQDVLPEGDATKGDDHPTSSPQAEDAAPPRHRRRRGGIVAAILLVALLVWWVAARIQDTSGAPAPTTRTPAGTSPAGTAVAEGTPERIARMYESDRLAGRVDATCRRDRDPEACRAGFGSTPVTYKLSEPVHVLQSQTLLSGGGVGGQATSTAVLVAFAIQSEPERRVALLVQDGLVIDREPIGSDNADQPLTTIFGETS